MKRIALGFLLFLTAFFRPAEAQDGGSRYILAPGAGNRALAMGGAYGAVADDASAPLWNPGGLALIPRAQFQASRTSYYGLDMSEEFLGLAIPNWRWGTLAATFRHFGAEGLDGRDASNFVTDEFSDGETQMTLSYGRRFGEAWSVGTSLKLLNQSLAGASGSGVGVDAGIIAFPGLLLSDRPEWVDRISIGLAVHNLVEPSLRLDEESVPDPISTRVGFAYRHPFGSTDRVLTAAFDLETRRQENMNLFAGLEFRLLPSLSLRTGLRQGVPTLGTRAQWRDFAFDYVFESTNLEDLHRFGVSLNFGTRVEQARMEAFRRQQEELDGRLTQAFAERQAMQTRQLLENAETVFSEGRHEEALEILAVASVISSDDGPVRPLRIRCLLGKAKEEEGRSDFAEAAVTYRQALALDPTNLEATAGSERCRSESNRLADRSAQFQEQFSKGLDAFTAGDLLSARDIFTGILAGRPADAEVSKMLSRTNVAIERRVEELDSQARSFIRTGSYSGAESALAEAARLIPDSRFVEATRAVLAGARNESRKARQDETAPPPNAPVAPTSPLLTPEQRADLQKFYDQGVTSLKEGRTQDAIRYWEWVYSLDPGYRRVREYLKREHHLLGIQAFSEGRLAEAVGFWETALRYDPEDAKTRAYLDRARQHLERSRAVTGG